MLDIASTPSNAILLTKRQFPITHTNLYVARQDALQQGAVDSGFSGSVANLHQVIFWHSFRVPLNCSLKQSDSLLF
jgi:hypothetical protein